MYLIHRILTDARFALRLLRRSPGFGATLLGVLVVGIGATTAMFSLVTSLLLRPLSYPHPEELMMVWAVQPHVPLSPASMPDFLDWKEQATTFERMSAVNYDAFNLSSEGGKPENLPGARVSGDFFPMLGITPLRGRLLNPDDDRVGAPRIAVISAAVWHARFGSDPGLVGRAVALNGEAYIVVGIGPEGFRFAGPHSARCDVWTPLSVTPSAYAESRGAHFIHVMGRRNRRVSIAQAQAQLSGIARTSLRPIPCRTRTSVSDWSTFMTRWSALPERASGCSSRPLRWSSSCAARTWRVSFSRRPRPGVRRWLHARRSARRLAGCSCSW